MSELDEARAALLMQADYMLRAALDLLCGVMPADAAHMIVNQICEDHERERNPPAPTVLMPSTARH